MAHDNSPLSEQQIVFAVHAVLQGRQGPKWWLHALQVESYLEDVFRAASELPKDIADLDLQAVRKARFQGFENKVFKNPAPEIPPAYRAAYEAWLARQR